MSKTISITNINVHRPNFSETEAAEIALTLFGLTVTATALPSERDQNFRLAPIEDFGIANSTIVPDDNQHKKQRYVLKIASGAETWEMLDMQNSAMKHIMDFAPDIPCPRVVKTLSGEMITDITSAKINRADDHSDVTHFVRLLTYLEGVPLARSKPHTSDLLQAIGVMLGKVDRALTDFSHPAAPTDFHWDLQNASETVRTRVDQIRSPERRALVAYFLNRFDEQVAPRLSMLRQSIIHNDANDYNVIVQRAPLDASGVPGRIEVGVIDFGDMVHSMTIGEVAIGAAYALLDKPDPLVAASEVVRGYNRVNPLTEIEIELLYDLICMRLCTSVVMSAQQQQLEPDNDYLKISEQPAWSALFWLREASPALAHYMFRAACGLSANPDSKKVVAWLEKNRARVGPVIAEPLQVGNAVAIDFGISSPLLQSAPALKSTDALTDHLFHYMEQAGAHVGIGRYNEARNVYAGEMFATGDGRRGSERRTIHMGIDLFVEAGASIYAPLDGMVHSFQNNKTNLDYGPCIILVHKLDDGTCFYTLYGHLSLDSLDGLTIGMRVAKGDEIARVGTYPINGDWPPHLHFQLITDMLGRQGEFPGVAAASQRAIWQSICPNPNVILNIPTTIFPSKERSTEALIAGRQQSIEPSLDASYQKQLKIVRRDERHLFDENGRAYLMFGDNPIAWAAELAAQDGIEEEEPQENERAVGEHLLAELKKLQSKYALIGDVRGSELSVGVEFVLGAKMLEPATAQAAYIVKRAKDMGILLNTDGSLYNVIKLKPPSNFDQSDVDFLIETLEQILQDDLLQG